MKNFSIKSLLNELYADDDDLSSIEVGDVVDVDVDEIGMIRARVLELVDDVNAHAGPPDPRAPGVFTGPGFIADTDDGRMVFSLRQVVPGSKAKYYFPDADEGDVNPYRSLASGRTGNVVGEAIERYVPGQLQRDLAELEAYQHGGFVNEASDYVELPYYEIISKIEQADADDVSDVDYVDMQTGEIMWEKGERAGDTQWHPESKQRKEEEQQQRAKEINVFGYGEEYVWSFERLYNVVMLPLKKVLGDPEYVASLDYDVDAIVPVSVSRRDASPLTDHDMQNMDDYIDAWNGNYSRTYRVELAAWGARAPEMKVRFDHSLI